MSSQLRACGSRCSGRRSYSSHPLWCASTIRACVRYGRFVSFAPIDAKNSVVKASSFWRFSPHFVRSFALQIRGALNVLLGIRSAAASISACKPATLILTTGLCLLAATSAALPRRAFLLWAEGSDWLWNCNFLGPAYIAGM